MNTLDKENLHKEIDLIQSCITRMASNSFLIKGWTISIIAIVLALVDKEINPLLLCLMLLLPLIAFWWLDAFFLYTEKLYRKLYEWVITERPKKNAELMYNLNPHRFKDKLFQIKKDKKPKKLETQFSVMLSSTLLSFYGIIAAIIIVTGIFIFFNKEPKPIVSNVQQIEIVKIPQSSEKTVKVEMDSVPAINVNAKIENQCPNNTNEVKNKENK